MIKKIKSWFLSAPEFKNNAGVEPYEKRVVIDVQGVQDVREIPTFIGRTLVADWHNAVHSAKLLPPFKSALYSFYKYVISENSVVQSCLQQRVDNLLDSELIFTRPNGEAYEGEDDLLTSDIIQNIIKELITARGWGYTLLNFNKDVRGGFQVVPHWQVRGELGIISKTIDGFEGENYLTGLAKQVIYEVGDHTDLGLFQYIGDNCLYLKHNKSDFNALNQETATPLIHGKYKHEKDKNSIFNLKEVGKQSIIVTNDTVEIDKIRESSVNNGDSFLKEGEERKKEIREMLLYSSSDESSSYVEADSKQSRLEAVLKRDKEYVIKHLNKLIPYLQRIGVNIPKNVKFSYREKGELSLMDRLKIDTFISTKIDYPAEYWHNTYNAPVGDAVKPQNNSLKEGLAALSGYYASFQKLQDTPTDEPNEFFALVLASFNQVIDMFKSLPVEIIRYSSEFQTYIQNIFKAIFPYSKDTVTELIYNNAFIFSASKAETALKELARLYELYGSDFETFAAKASDFTKVFNKAWLEAEYEVMRAGVDTFKMWEKFVDESEVYPYLMYVTQDDDRVRPAHQILHGITRRIDDKFWRENATPNGYRCRCFAKQVKEGDAVETNQSILNAIYKSEEYQSGVPEYFRTNVYYSGYIVTKDHPYFQ